ncbi:LEPR-XLL domain-containing protein [Halomonas sp. TBZ9]|uniref:LEPR-XLL domain-containing protein n=1 Tax=Vreelandella azerica TaxID=2732867 RepID=A0A7Y3U005_9GAMM|nr:LEPR-XLL domain-containing protein [Halomonas azerica]NOG32830.1 LEPR-XLL domain-containing protein [Halomonas azerica]
MNRPFQPTRKMLSALVGRLSRRDKTRRAYAKKSRFIFEGLEQRMLLSADPFTAALEGGGDFELRVAEEEGEQHLMVMQLTDDGDELVEKFQTDEAREEGRVTLKADDNGDIKTNLSLLLGDHASDLNDITFVFLGEKATRRWTLVMRAASRLIFRQARATTALLIKAAKMEIGVSILTRRAASEIAGCRFQVY